MKNFTILSIAISLLVGACIRKECRDIPGGYEFEIPVTLSPARDTFKVGDTIFVSSEFDNRVFERKTQKEYPLEDWSFHPVMDIHKIDTAPFVNGIPYFDFIVPDSMDYRAFVFSDGWTSFTGQYSYMANRYTLRYQVIPNSSGLFCLYQASAQTLNDRQDFSGKCSGISSNTVVVLNSNAVNNIEFLSESPDSFISEWIPERPMERFYNSGGYCFYVVE
jgi:hypothetical protein